MNGNDDDEDSAAACGADGKGRADAVHAAAA
jgi:hypothetical protein